MVKFSYVCCVNTFTSSTSADAHKPNSLNHLLGDEPLTFWLKGFNVISRPACSFMQEKLEAPQIVACHLIRAYHMKVKSKNISLTNYMQQRTSRKANTHLISQKIPRLLRNQKVHYRVHKSPPLIPTLNQMHPAPTSSPYIHKIHSNIILPSTPVSSKLSLPFRFSNHNIARVSHVPCVLYAPPISSSLIWSP
jgi:hypothetical protein